MTRIDHILQTLDRSDANKHPVPISGFVYLIPIGEFVETDGTFDFTRCYEHFIDVWLEHRDWKGYALVMLDGEPVCVAYKRCGNYYQYNWFSQAARSKMLNLVLDIIAPFPEREEYIIETDADFILEDCTGLPKHKRYFKEQV